LWSTKWHWERFFSEYFGFPLQYHSTNAPYSSPFTYSFYQKEKRANPMNLPDWNSLSYIGEHWAEKFIFVAFVPARHTAEAWEPLKAKRCPKSESDGRKVCTFTLSLKGFKMLVSLYSSVTIVTGFRAGRP
jgi:hypothetical protein